MAGMAEVLQDDDTAAAWSRRELARQRQIMIGKARPEYRRYVTKIPPDCRSSSQPTTPDPRERVSKRQFDHSLSEWRRKLHEYDASPGSSWNDGSARGWPVNPGPSSPSLAVCTPYGDEACSTQEQFQGEGGEAPLSRAAVQRTGYRRQRPTGTARAEWAGWASTGRRGPHFSTQKGSDADFCSPNVESEPLAPDPSQANSQVVCLRLADQLPGPSAQMPVQDNIQMEPFDMSQHAPCTGPWPWALQYMDEMPDLAWYPETPQKNALMPVAMCRSDDLLHFSDETPQKSIMPPRNGIQMMEEWTPQKMASVDSHQDEHMGAPDVYGCHGGELEETQDAGTSWDSTSTSTTETAAEISSQTGPGPPKLLKSPRTPPRTPARSVSPQSSIAATPARGCWGGETPSPERLYSASASYGSRSPPRHPIQSSFFSMPHAAMWSQHVSPLVPMISQQPTGKNETMPALM